MTGLKKIKGLILFVSLLYLTFYIPMTLTFYFPQWMELNCGWHNRCEQIGNERSIKGINELASYFRHQGELNSFLTQKEKLHLKEVRGIFDKMLILGLVSLVILLLAYNRKKNVPLCLNKCSDYRYFAYSTAIFRHFLEGWLSPPSF